MPTSRRESNPVGASRLLSSTLHSQRSTLLNPLLPIIGKEQYGGGVVPQTQIRIAKLGNDAGIIGAALLGMQG